MHWGTRTHNTSQSRHESRFSGRSNICAPVNVHGDQQWFVFPSSLHGAPLTAPSIDMIIMARTANDKQSSPFPFFPHQYRVSALHLLVHMIATALQFSARAVSDKLRRISMNLVRVDRITTPGRCRYRR